MQGRVLQEVEGYTVAQWEKEYERLRKILPKFREEIQAIESKEQKVLAIAKLDGFVSLPVVMAILAEIREITEKEISETYTRLTGKDIKKAITNKSMREIFAKVCDKDIRAILEKLTADTRTDDLTAEKVQTTITAYATAFLNKIKKDYKRDVKEKEAEALLLPLLCNQLYILCASDLYVEADARQTAGWLKIKALMGPFLLRTYPKEALQNPFIAVRECAKLLQVNVATGQLWREAALWLEGLHMRCFLNVPEKYRKDGKVVLNEQGKMPLSVVMEKGVAVVNSKDQKFQENFDLTLYEMGLFHFQTAQNIEARFAPSRLAADAALVSSQLPPASAPVAIPQPLPAPVTNLGAPQSVSPPVTGAMDPQSVPRSSPRPIPLASVAEVPRSETLSSSPVDSSPTGQRVFASSAPQPLPSAAQAATGVSHYTTGATLFCSPSSKDVIPVVPATLLHFHALEAINDEADDEQKFTMFSNYLDEYNLNERQARLLREFPDTVVGKLKVYTDAYFTTNWIPTALVTRKHAQLASETKEYIESESNIAEQIKTLCSMWRTLKYCKSKDLIDKIESSIKFAIGILYKDAKLFKDTKESSERQATLRANH